MLLRTTAPALVLLAALLSGCSGDGDGCAGTTYEVDLSAAGAETSIDALDAWLANPEGLDELPPADDWIVRGGGDPDAEEVEILNEGAGAGWWVHLIRTDEGGYVVDQATNEWTSCEDELS